jgi:O-antigen ligase
MMTRLENSLLAKPIEKSWIIFVLLLATSFYSWGRVTIGPLNIPLVMLWLPPVVFLWIVSFPFYNFNRGKSVFFMNPPIAGLLIMLFGMILSMLNTENVQNSIAVLCEICFYVFLYVFMMHTIRTQAILNKVLFSLILGITILAFEGLFRFFITKSIWRIGAGDILTATNMGAFMFQAGIIFVLSRILLGNWKPRILIVVSLMSLVVLLAAFPFTYSRGAWITSLPGLAIVLSHRKRLILPLLLLCSLCLPFLPDSVMTRITSVIVFKKQSTVMLSSEQGGFRDAEVQNTTNLRLRNQINALEQAYKSPFFGMGIGHYHSVDSQEKGETAPHNAYLRILAESGPLSALGFIVFVICHVRLLLSAVKSSNQESKWVFVAFFSVFVTHAFYMLVGDWPYQIYFWLFSGLGGACAKSA